MGEKNDNMDRIYAGRVEAVREFVRDSGLGGFILCTGDEYMNEFVHPYSKRLEWLTGFSGSAGCMIVLEDRAVVMSDGRYIIQMEEELDRAVFETADITKISPGEWICQNVGESVDIGYDPSLVTEKFVRDVEKALEGRGVNLIPLVYNPVDVLWSDGRPEKAAGEVFIFPDEVAGKTSLQKRQEIADMLGGRGCEAALLVSPESVCWLLNVRGSDVPYLPVVLSCVLLRGDGSAVWFIDRSRFGNDVVFHVGEGVEIYPFEEFENILKALGRKKAKIFVDERRTSLWFINAVRDCGCVPVYGEDLCILPRAVKSDSEIEAMRQAHIEDGAAVCRMLCWVDRNISPARGLYEGEIGDRFNEFRALSSNFVSNSFPNIIAFGKNGAITHYNPGDGTEKGSMVEGGGLLLMDTGGQYRYGTTDITRTVAIGKPDRQAIEDYTLVLKGHIAVATARFPEGVSGAKIDMLARKPLWDSGLDYNHGTGHGVGCFLSVHEESANLSPKSEKELKAGMVITNEPGCYREGMHGIRLENVLFVNRCGYNDVSGRGMLCFETISLAPFDRRLIDAKMLERYEIEWIDNYHAKVFDSISPLLDEDEIIWLEKACVGI